MKTSQFVSRFSFLREQVPSFDEYPFNLPLIHELGEVELHPKITFFVGENGSGKSTLIEALAVALRFNAEGGSRNFSFATRATHSPLHRYLRVARSGRRPRTDYFLRAESFYNVATEIENLNHMPLMGPLTESYGGESLHSQSHGESFLSLLMHRFGPQGLYILDEPESALSPQRQLAALARIHDLVCQQSQFLIATHSPILMAYPDAWILQCSAEGLRRIPYEETEHFRITRDFLMNPRRMLDELFKDAPTQTDFPDFS